MRLINTRTLELEVFIGPVPRYAILSHTWGPDEACLRGWRKHRGSLLTLTHGGYAKVHMARGQALNDGIEYLWVDTVCIDESSQAEVSEAINAMFWWYRNAYVCYTHLSDVGTSEDDTAADVAEMMADLHRSRWFTRGWTLQELLAPKRVVFYSKFWTRLGTKQDMAGCLARVTGIEEKFLLGAELSSASVAKRMSWMAQRHTTRPEDLVYSIMGLFDINMPLLYGEGRKAFARLQAEIVKQSADETLFCWSWNEETPVDWVSLLAPWPSNFANSGRYEATTSATATTTTTTSSHCWYKLTNMGMNISLSLTSFWSLQLGVLNVLGPNASPVGIALAGHPDKGILWRASFPPGPIELPQKRHPGRAPSTGYGSSSSQRAGAALSRKNVCVLSRMPKSGAAAAAAALTRPLLFSRNGLSAPLPFKYVVMVSFSDKSDVDVVETMPAGMFDERASVLALEPSARRRGMHGAMIRMRAARSRCEMRFLFAINAGERPCWYFVDLTPPSSGPLVSSAASSRSSSRCSNTALDTTLAAPSGQEDLETQLEMLSAKDAVRGTRDVRRVHYHVSLGRALRMAGGGILRVVHIRTGRPTRDAGVKGVLV